MVRNHNQLLSGKSLPPPPIPCTSPLKFMLGHICLLRLMLASSLPKKQPTRVSRPLIICGNIPLISCLYFQNDLETLGKEVAAEEAEMSEQQQRVDAQRAIEFYDELGSELASPFALLQRFSAPYCFFPRNLIVCERGACYHAAVPVPRRLLYQNRDRSLELGGKRQT
jgi:hypothetical protein